MECPKCGGGVYLAEEELVKVLENTEPLKVIIKATYICRACSERFSRLVYDNLEARNKNSVTTSAPAPQVTSQESEHVEGLKFF